MKLFLVCSFVLLCGCIAAQKKVQLASPDGNIVFSFSLQKNKPYYSVAYNKQMLVQNSSLNLVFDDASPLQNCSMRKKPKYAEGVESYSLVVGKTALVNHAYKEAIIFLKGGEYFVNFNIKAFNDGVAFKYVFASKKDNVHFTLLEEETQFNIAGNPIIKSLQLPNFTTSHEGIYTTAPLSKIRNDTLMDIPALLQFPNNTFMAITEAALLDYAGMYLIKRKGILTSQLSPLPNQNAIKAKLKPNHQSPWRVMLIGNNIGTLIQSNILTSLCPPLAIKETNWIQTGTTTFPWWN